MRQESKRSLNYARSIFYAGRQRMLSQKLTKLCYQKQLGEDTRTEITANLATWSHSQNSLQTGYDSLLLLAKDQPVTLQLLKQMEPLQERLTYNFSIAAEQQASAELLQQIENDERAFLEQMGTVISVIESNAVSNVQYANEKQNLLGLLSGLLLLLEMIFFVYPYHRKLVNAYKKLKLQQVESDVQKHKIEELNTSNELTISGINAGVWNWNILTGEEVWSPKFFHLLGYETNELPATYDTFTYLLLHPDDRDKVNKAIDAHLQQHVPYRVEARLLHKNGTYRWFETTGQALWNEEGIAVRMAGSIIDKDERMRYRQYLEYNEFMLEETGKLACVGGWEYTLATQEVNWTRTMYEILEITGNQTRLPSAAVNNYLPQYREQIRKAVEKATTQGEPFDIEVQLVTDKGNIKWIRTIGLPVFNDKKEVIRLRGVYQDINRQKLRELELIDTKEKLDESNHAKDKLFSIIAHDLRGPIINLKGLIELLQKEQIDKDQFLHYTADVNISISFLSETMDNLLHWAQSQLKGFTVNLEDININAVIRQTTDLYARAIAYKNITLINNNPVAFFVHADLNHVLLIVRNLLNNAIKFTPEGGSITIDTTESTGIVSIRIADTGVGMSEEELEKINHQTFINSRQGTNGEKGTGLGLGLCYEIAEKNGGTIQVASKKGEGTVFTLILPKVGELSVLEH